MLHIFRHVLLALGTAFMLGACGGGGGADDAGPGPAPGSRPTAHAGSAQTVDMGSTVTLDGSASSSPHGARLTYRWTLAAVPDGSEAQLSSDSVVTPSFVADKPGKYIADLVVNNGTSDSEHARVTVTVTNTDPVAITDLVLSAGLGETVALDARQSLAPSNGETLSYRWALDERPAGSKAALLNATSALAQLRVDLAGRYKLILVVSSGGRQSDPVEVLVTATAGNTLPIAHAGKALTVQRGEKVVLDGSASSDADGDVLSFYWRFFSENFDGRPQGSQAELSHSHSAQPFFTPDTVGTFSVVLQVFDGTALSAPSWVRVTVNKPDGAPNIPPVARIEPMSTEAELGAKVFIPMTSYDIDGDALTHRWRWVSTPSGFVQNDLNKERSFVASVAGSYTVEAVANDGKVDSAPTQSTWTARTGAYSRPLSRITTDAKTVLVRTTAQFDGSSSQEPGGAELQYEWRFLDRPSNSKASLHNAGSARPSFTPDLPGPYVVGLKVSNPLVPISSSRDAIATIVAKSRNNPPTVHPAFSAWGGGHAPYTQEQPFLLDQDWLGEKVNIFSNAFDPDGDGLYYLWTLTEQPAGSQLEKALSSETAQSWQFKPLVEGWYGVSVVVSDGIAMSAAQSLQVKAVKRENYPSLLLEYGGQDDEHTPMRYQSLFPHINTSYPSVPADTDDHIRYRLTAFDRDYTLVDVRTSSQVAGYAPHFEGLSDGQVLRKGESIIIKLRRPAIPGESPSQAVDSEELASYGFEWSFRVAEKPGWTFKSGHCQSDNPLIWGQCTPF